MDEIETLVRELECAALGFHKTGDSARCKAARAALVVYARSVSSQADYWAQRYDDLHRRVFHCEPAQVPAPPPGHFWVRIGDRLLAARDDAIYSRDSPEAAIRAVRSTRQGA